MWKLTLLLTLLIISMGCQKDVDVRTKVVDIPQFDNYKNFTEAPENIRNSAKAVVMINKNGTGSFLSEEGLFMTNEHVLGSDSCPRSGCYVELYFNYQVGEEPQEPKLLFAEPVRIELDLDIALYQIKEIGENNNVKDNLATPDYLHFKSQTPDELLGQKLFITGHPYAELKKWNTGTVIEKRNNWISLDAFVLGGNSGSPILNEAGEVVALVHRGMDGSSFITKNSMQTTTLATASAAIIERLNIKEALLTAAEVSKKESLDVLVNIDSTSIDPIWDRALILSAKRLPKISGEERTIKSWVFDRYAKACDEALDKKIEVPEDTISAVASKCLGVVSFANCLDNKDPSFKYCPIDKEKDSWLERMYKSADKIKEANYSDVYSLVIAPGVFGKGPTQALDIMKGSLDRYISANSPRLSFGLVDAKALVADKAEDMVYQDVDLIQYLRDFPQSPNYDREYEEIIKASMSLFSKGAFSAEDLTKTFKTAFTDDKITISDRLIVERLAFEKGLLKTE